MKKISVLLFAIVLGGFSSAFAGGQEQTPVQCDNYQSCGVNNPCANEQQAACTIISQCENPICISDTAACLAECGTPTCTFLESYPRQVSCD